MNVVSTIKFDQLHFCLSRPGCLTNVQLSNRYIAFIVEVLKIMDCNYADTLFLLSWFWLSYVWSIMTSYYHWQRVFLQMFGYAKWKSSFQSVSIVCITKWNNRYWYNIFSYLLKKDKLRYFQYSSNVIIGSRKCSKCF